MTMDVVEVALRQLRSERDEARAELAKAKESNGSLLAILERLSARLTPEESASVAGEVARGARDRTQLRAELDKAREELKAAEYVGQLAARDRDNALAERNRWQDKACKLENELVHLQRLEATVYGPQGRELATLRAAVWALLDEFSGCAACDDVATVTIAGQTNYCDECGADQPGVDPDGHPWKRDLSHASTLRALVGLLPPQTALAKEG